MNISIRLRDVQLKVEYHYFACEPQQRYDSNLEGYPGANSRVEILAVTYKDKVVTELIEKLNLMDEIEQIILDSYVNSED